MISQVLAGLEAQEQKKQLKDRVMQGPSVLLADKVYKCFVGSSGVDKEVKIVDEHREEVLKASTSKGAESPKNDANNDDDNENGSFSSSGDPNFRGFTKEETKVLSSMIKKKVGKAIKNVMPYYISQTTDNLKEIVRKELEELRKGELMNDFRNEMATYHDFTACDVPKFDGTLDPIASTRWLLAVKGAFRTSRCKAKNKLKVEMFQRMLRDDIREVISPFKCTALDNLLSRARKNLPAIPNKLPFPLEVKIAGSEVLVVSNVYRDVEIEIDDSIFRIDLIPVVLGVFDIVIDMDWLDKYNVNILCSQKLVPVVNPQGREIIIIYGDKRMGDFKLCFVMKARKYLSHGCYAYMAYVIYTSFKKKSVEDVPIVNDILDVF
nr:zinc finger, CCHC-type, retrotransposon Gag domain protein [Tanacetum cinerariifolium]